MVSGTHHAFKIRGTVFLIIIPSLIFLGLLHLYSWSVLCVSFVYPSFRCHSSLSATSFSGSVVIRYLDEPGPGCEYTNYTTLFSQSTRKTVILQPRDIHDVWTSHFHDTSLVLGMHLMYMMYIMPS